MRVNAVFLFLPLLLTGSGCCGLFEPSEAGTRKWVIAEIPVGASAQTAQGSLDRHGFPIRADFNPPTIWSEKHVGACLFSLTDEYIQIRVFFDSKGYVTRTEVEKRSEGL